MQKEKSYFGVALSRLITLYPHSLHLNVCAYSKSMLGAITSISRSFKYLGNDSAIKNCMPPHDGQLLSERFSKRFSSSVTRSSNLAYRVITNFSQLKSLYRGI